MSGRDGDDGGGDDDDSVMWHEAIVRGLRECQVDESAEGLRLASTEGTDDAKLELKEMFVRKFNVVDPQVTVEFNFRTKIARCERDPLRIAGRYVKLARGVSHTPFGVDHKSITSIQNLLLDNLAHIKAAKTTFMSSGREDLDVRMLNTGRPFLVEFKNPQKRYAFPDEITTKYARFFDLKSASADDASKLKASASSKSKTYRVVCSANKNVSSSLLDLEKVFPENTEIVQKTPLRVAHRRAKMERKKIVCVKVLKALTNRVFVLQIDTSAGTYVKELVHGDLGRTYPSVSQVLKADVAVLQLDVWSVSE